MAGLTKPGKARRLLALERKNPFPGMNPWMQLVWSDVHTRLIGDIAEALGDELPADLVARAEERVVLNEPDEGERIAKAAESEVYPCALRLPLPAVAVPLRQGEPDAALNLQPLIDRCYAKGRYWLLPYDEPPPGLDPDDLAWIRTTWPGSGRLGLGPNRGPGSRF